MTAKLTLSQIKQGKPLGEITVEVYPASIGETHQKNIALAGIFKKPVSDDDSSALMMQSIEMELVVINACTNPVLSLDTYSNLSQDSLAALEEAIRAENPFWYDKKPLSMEEKKS